jgi:hypothetical protein
MLGDVLRQTKEGGEIELSSVGEEIKASCDVEVGRYADVHLKEGNDERAEITIIAEGIAHSQDKSKISTFKLALHDVKLCKLSCLRIESVSSEKGAPE